MRITARGAVARDAEGARFQIDGWPVAYPIDGDAPADGPCSVRAGVRFEDGAPRLHLVED
jgi:hypothetical protein